MRAALSPKLLITQTISTAPNYENASSVPLSVQRTLRGPSQARGELSVVVTNHESVEIQTVYLETMPWLLQFYLHTLRVTHNGEPRGKFNHTELRSLSHQLTLGL